MDAVELRRPESVDSNELYHFFKLVIMDTFAKEGIAHLVHDMEQEIEAKMNYLSQDLQTNGRERYFYVALHNEKIIGTIESGHSSKLIHVLTQGALDKLIEIGTVLVHPDFQGRGVAKLLLNATFLYLQGKGASEFCLDCGYKNAQHIWKKKFGEPTYIFPDYWGSGTDHMIWRRSIIGQSLRFIIS